MYIAVFIDHICAVSDWFESGPSPAIVYTPVQGYVIPDSQETCTCIYSCRQFKLYMYESKHSEYCRLKLAANECYATRLKITTASFIMSHTLCGVLCISFTFGKVSQACFMNNHCWINHILQSVTATIKLSLLLESGSS